MLSRMPSELKALHAAVSLRAEALCLGRAGTLGFAASPSVSAQNPSLEIFMQSASTSSWLWWLNADGFSEVVTQHACAN